MARTATSPGAPTTRLGKTAYEFDERMHLTPWIRRTLNKVYPDHWSFLLGEIALYSFIVLLLSGTYLTFFFDASMQEVVYEGSYAPAARRGDVGGLRLDAATVLRRARRPVHAPGPPLGRAAVRRGDRRPPDAHLLHGRVPPAARDQLADRRRDAGPRPAHGRHRLLAAGRPALRHRSPHHQRDPAVRPGHRHLGALRGVQRGLRRHRDHRALLHRPRAAAARRSCCC